MYKNLSINEKLDPNLYLERLQKCVDYFDLFGITPKNSKHFNYLIDRKLIKDYGYTIHQIRRLDIVASFGYINEN